VSLCGASTSLDKLCAGLYGVTGSSPRRAAIHRRWRGPAPRGRYGLRHLAQKDQGIGVVLTVLWKRRKGWRRGIDEEVL
jgi:hypothetical protein